METKDKNYPKNIIQGYTQSNIVPNFIVIYYLSAKFKKKYLKSTDVCVAKLLYNLTKAKNHLFEIYLNYYQEKS